MGLARKQMIRSARRLRDAMERVEEFEAALQSDIAGLFESEGHGSAHVLARELGVSKAYLSDIKNRNRGIGKETVIRISMLNAAQAAGEKK